MGKCVFVSTPLNPSSSGVASSKIHTQVEEKEEEEEEEETRSAKQCLQCPKSDASILTFLSVSCNKYSKKKKKKKKKKKPSQALKVAQNYSTCCREGAFSFSIFSKRLLLQDDGEEL
ncbi:unnamed protein product [Prunus brigantina]